MKSFAGPTAVCGDILGTYRMLVACGARSHSEFRQHLQRPIDECQSKWISISLFKQRTQKSSCWISLVGSMLGGVSGVGVASVQRTLYDSQL